MNAVFSETAPTPGAIAVDKIKKFGWNTQTNMSGTIKFLHKSQIKVDTTYQRELCLRNVRQIAREWDWSLFGRLTVGERADGSFFVCDGQHRLAAALNRSDIQQIPCEVFQSSGPAEEARIFLGMNTTHNIVTKIQLFKALVAVGDPVATAVQSTVNELGLTVPKKSGGNQPSRISCVAALMRAWELDPIGAETSLRVAKKVAVDSSITNELFRGIFTLHRKLKAIGDSILNHTEKLISSGHAAIMGSIRNHVMLMGVGGERAFAAGVLAVINKNKRKKIEIDGLTF